MSSLEDGSVPVANPTLKKRASVIHKMTRLRSRPGSSQPEAVGSIRKVSDPPHVDLGPMLRFQPFDSANTTPVRRTSNAPVLQRSAESSPHLGKTSRMPYVDTPPAIDQSSFLEPIMDSPLSNGDSSPWVGGTGLGSAGLGKSGRVIERLMAENDRLRREMKAEIAKREELQRAMQNQKPKLEGLQSENARLANIKTMDDNIIKRRDRKIEELKNELEVERKKRETADRRAQDAERTRDDHVSMSQKDLQNAQEEARHSAAHADILRTSHQQLSKEYRQRITTSNKALRELAEDKEMDRKALARLDVVVNQQRQESERSRKLYGDLMSMHQRIADEKKAQFEILEADAQRIKSVAAEREKENMALRHNMEEVLGRMRWVMQLEKQRSDVHSPPPSPPV